jgi:hypothetical protein
MAATTYKNGVKILEHVKNAGNLNLKFISNRGGVTMKETEKLFQV